jgi:thiol:disulfide interchange protein DsbC
MRFLAVGVMIVTVLLVQNAYAAAAGVHENDCASCHTLTLPEANKLLANIGEVKSVKQSTAKGLFELVIEGQGQKALIYVDYSKKHIIPGPVFDIATRKPITEPIRNTPPPPAKIDPTTIPLDNSVLMGNPKGTKKLFVFTDPDCPYCSKLHVELKKLVTMDPDVLVYVKMYPLQMHPQAYDKARAILTAKNPSEALDKAFSGAALPIPGGDGGKAAVDQTLKFANGIGVNSTPTLVFPDGRIEAGAKPAEDIRKQLSDASK